MEAVSSFLKFEKEFSNFRLLRGDLSLNVILHVVKLSRCLLVDLRDLSKVENLLETPFEVR
jgi:hypothetical protein